MDDSDCGLYTNRSLCGGYGGYNESISTTVKKLDDKFAYNDSGVMTEGDFVTDVLKIGGVILNSMKMGIVTNRIITSSTNELSDRPRINR